MSGPGTPVDRPAGTNRTLIAAVLGVLVVLVVIAASWAFLGGDDDSAADTDGTSAESDSGSDDPDRAGNPDEDPARPGQPSGDPGASDEPEWTLPVEAVTGDTESSRCAAVLVRLEVHRDLAERSGTEALTLLFESTSELEAQVVSLAEAQDWGDRIVAGLTDVRREWADARSAASAGEDDEANRAAARAIERLDAVIAEAACPE